MKKKMLLNGKVKRVGEEDLPMLIHGAHGKGASLFTVSVVANLYRQGFKIVFLSGYPMARDELREQIGNVGVMCSDKMDKNAKVVFIPREEAELLVKLSGELDDFEERVVVIKNVELFDKEIVRRVMKAPKLIVAGDLSKCDYWKEIMEIGFSSKVWFSPLDGVRDSLPEMKKYQGYWQQKLGATGIVELG